MKKLLYIVLLAYFVFLTSNLDAQDSRRFHFGPKIGLSVTDIRYKEFYESYYQFAGGYISYTNMKLNFSAGLIIEYDLIPTEKYGLSIDIVPQYVKKGCWYLSDGLSGNIYMHYMDIPVELHGKLRISKSKYMVLGLGPTFNIGIIQVNKSQEPVGNDIKHYKSILQFDENGNGLHRLDIGSNATIGIESIRGFRFDLSYYFPLRNLSIDKSKSVKHFSVAASIGYMF